jgi:hypothetical protein
MSLTTGGRLPVVVRRPTTHDYLTMVFSVAVNPVYVAYSARFARVARRARVHSR